MLWQLFWLKISKNKCKCKPLLNALICKFSNTLLHCHLSLALFLLFSFFAVLRFVWFLLDGLFSILAPFWLPWMSNDRKAVFMASDSGVTVASIETEGKPDGNGHKVGSTPHPALQFSTFYFPPTLSSPLSVADKHGANWKRRQTFFGVAEMTSRRWFHWQFRWWIPVNGPGKNAKITWKHKRGWKCFVAKI